MRTYFLHTIDKSKSFNLNTDSVLAAEPTGLGNAFATSYKESASGKHLSNVRPDFPEIKLTIYFNADGSGGAANYKGLLSFLASCGKSPFLFQYNDGINEKFCEVVNKTLPRSDIDEDGVFAEDFVFERQTYWYEELAESFALKRTSRDATAFPLGFPFGFYGHVFQKEYKARNAFFEDAPIDITISGEIASNIYLYIDNANTRERVAELQLNVNSNDNTVIRITPTPNKKILIITDGVAASRYDITDKTKDSFLYLPYGEYIIGSNMVDTDSGKIEMSIKRYLFD